MRMADIPGMAEITTAPARPGRRCAVCSLPANERTATELALANGVSIARIVRQPYAPSRDSIRRHIRAGHLPAQTQEQVERTTGLDRTSVVARISDVARRARETALTAAEAGDRISTLKAGDSELRALGALVAMRGPDASEAEIELDSDARNVYMAVINVSKTDSTFASRLAEELEILGHVTVAAEILGLNSQTLEIEQ